MGLCECVYVCAWVCVCVCVSVVVCVGACESVRVPLSAGGNNTIA